MKFDNHDSLIRYVELEFIRHDLKNIPSYNLPDGYHFTFYKPGDKDQWIEIEKSAKEFLGYEQGLESWNRYYAGREDSLFNRMVFIETDSGEKVATATAYYDIYGRDKTNAAWLHWVAVRRDHQGKGLSKPLIAYTLGLMWGLGYDHVKLSSQTNTWLACKIYLDFGFVPDPQSVKENLIGWEILRTITNHPSLTHFRSATEAEILSKENIEFG